MRTFIAIELPKVILDSLALLEDRLKNTGADVKWVEPRNIHLTLKFLGEVDQQKLEKINEALKSISGDKKTFHMRVSSIGAFPKISSPRIIWVGIDKGDNETKEITEGLEEKLAKLDIPKEDRPFSSHITIGRVKSTLNRDKLIQELTAAEGILKMGNLEFNVERITLFQSTLTPNGPVYNPLKTADLTTI